MNVDQAKRIKLVDLMQLLGFQVMEVERGSTEHKYFSPFRSEKTPSLNVNLPKNSWYDFGLGKGGNTLDFAIHYTGFIGQGETVSSALKWLDNVHGRVGGRKPLVRPVVPDAAKKSKLELLEVTDVKARAIFSYLENERKINPELIPLYLKQVRYKNHSSGKTFFAYGTENLSGGYEIRVATDAYPFKSAVNGRDVSLFAGASHLHHVVNVFEGTTDFLSLLTMMKTDRLSGDTIVMHSLSSYKRTLEVIKEKGYKSVNLFLDNNQPGEDHTAAFIRDLSEIEVTSQAQLFLPYEDINEALKASAVPKILQG
jgi:hypothetical protein